ncbi:hypothetical protein MO973_01905 [Paenibacillus sp. TRM 82003]|nr:hypothetical protein [Paenibacillus sp. TRM 82003]
MKQRLQYCSAIVGGIIIILFMISDLLFPNIRILVFSQQASSDAITIHSQVSADVDVYRVIQQGIWISLT